ncbi:MAG: DUF3892 domain-containing protein [Planctomycetes bacterium]|nr:DUF3892 domain-containing protein [Planctomycetota bacterium]
MNASLAISHIRRGNDRSRIEYYRSFIPVAGIIGGAQIDVSRANMVKDLKDGKRVITVIQSDNKWIEGSDVHLTASGYVRTDHNDTKEDNLGELPEIEGQLFNRP